MSTPARIARGTGLTLGTVAINILGQIATVPIFLSRWDAETYGLWLLMMGGIGYLFLFSVAFQQYSYGEMLRAGSAARDAFRKVYRTSLAISVIVAVFDLVMVFTVTSDWFLAWILPSLQDTNLFEEVVYLLRLYSLLNIFIMPINAITAHANTVHGHYTRVAAWALVNAVFRLAAPAIAVLMGAGFWTTALIFILAHVASVSLALIDMVLLAQREGIMKYVPIAWRLGLLNMMFSLPLALQTLVDSLRQQGFRILLGIFVGPVAVTTLATTRTFANVLHQGLATITAPVLPELMRYVVTRDQDRTEGAFAIVWLFLFALLVPGVLLLCLLAGPIFVYWTRGAVAYDPVLFLTLVLAVIVVAAAQPAVAVLQGQNRVSWLIGAAIVSAVGLGALSAILIPYFKLRGAGFALLGAETCALSVAALGVRRALEQSELVFPKLSFTLVIANVTAVGALTLSAITVFRNNPLFFAVPLIANFIFGCLYWFTIPPMVRARIGDVLHTLMTRVRSLAVVSGRNDGNVSH